MSGATLLAIVLVLLGLFWLAARLVISGLRELAGMVAQPVQAIEPLPKEGTSAPSKTAPSRVDAYAHWVRMESALVAHGATESELRAVGEIVVRRLVHGPAKVEVGHE